VKNKFKVIGMVYEKKKKGLLEEASQGYCDGFFLMLSARIKMMFNV